VQRFRGGLVFKAHRLLYYSTLGLRVIKKKKKGTCVSAMALAMICFLLALASLMAYVRFWGDVPRQQESRDGFQCSRPWWNVLDARGKGWMALASLIANVRLCGDVPRQQASATIKGRVPHVLDPGGMF